MIEYLHNAIRATAGEDAKILALIAGFDGVAIDSGCHFMIYDDDDNLVAMADGVVNEENLWEFHVPTAELKGSYWYCICHEHERLCFKQPIYFVQEVLNEQLFKS